MDSQAWVALAAAVAAVVAVVAVVVLSLALRRTRADIRALQVSASEPAEPPPAPRERAQANVPVVTSLERTGEEAERDVVITRDGRAIVLPSSEQVVNATMGRPLVRGATLSYGLAHALRPESRDRIRGMVRREFRRRRKTRLQAGRRAARVTPVDVPSSQAWLGTRTPPPKEDRR